MEDMAVVETGATAAAGAMTQAIGAMAAAVETGAMAAAVVTGVVEVAAGIPPAADTGTIGELEDV